MPPVDDLVGAFLGIESSPSNMTEPPDGEGEAAGSEAAYNEFERLFSIAGGRIS